MRVAVLYATDFDRVSAGGILSFIRNVGAQAPEGWEITYGGVGPLLGPLPRLQDSFWSLTSADGPGKLNGRYVAALRHHAAYLRAFDAVICHRAEHVLALRRSGPPVVLMLHGGSTSAFKADKSVFGASYPLIETLASAASKSLLSVSPTSHWTLTRVVHEPKFQAQCFAEDIFRRDIAEPVRPRLLSVGRLVAEKRIEIILGAAVQLGWPVTVIGAGPEEASLRRRARSLGVSVDFKGHLTASQLAAAYDAQPGVFMMSSAFEGFPVALLEAMASGLPAVVLRSPGLAEAADRVGALSGETPGDLVSLAKLARASHPSRLKDVAEEIHARYSSLAVSAHYWGHVRDAVEATT